MRRRLNYGTTAKILHWLIVALLLVQYPIGWFMPDIHRGAQPGNAMVFHVSFGLTILAVLVIRFGWRVTHPVMPESTLPSWQRSTAEVTHWLLYALILATTIIGWLFASFRGWELSYFFIFRLPMLASESASGVRMIDGWHQFMEWSLLVVIGVHVAAAMAHGFLYRDRVMQRMLP